MAQSSFTSLPSRLKLERLKALLQDTAMTRQQVADALYVSPSRAGALLRFLHEQRPKQVYIASWDRFLASYQAGDKPDARRPRSYTKNERYHRQMDKMKKDGTYDLHWAKRRAARFKPILDDLTLSFFGKEVKSKPDPT